MFTKINKIKNFAVYKDFDWDNSVRDEGKNVGKFQKLNIIYGRNYSGKTSLSRIIRSLELKKPHEKYQGAEYVFSHEGPEILNHKTLESCPYNVRVYNKDFVDDNLRWLSNPDGSIKPFAVLGDENITLEKEIEEKEQALGHEETAGSLRHRFKSEQEQFSSVSKSAKTAQSNLDEKLRNKANGSIKINPNYLSVNYTISSIKQDINTLQKKTSASISPEKQVELITLLGEHAKSELAFKGTFNSKRDKLYNEAKILLEKQVKPTESIQELINDVLLQNWVRDGIPSHRDKRSNCAFCGSILPAELWGKLDAHFSLESDILRDDIKSLLNKIRSERTNIPKELPLKQSDFYSAYHSDFIALNEDFLKSLKQYDADLKSIDDQLSLRLNDIFKTHKTRPLDPENVNISKIYSQLEDLIISHNKKTETLEKDKASARTTLRLSEVNDFIINISYNKELKTISDLNNDAIKKQDTVNATRSEIENLEQDIQSLKNKLKDERRGAERVNHYLENHFGHTGLRLSALDNDIATEINFKIFRGMEPAENLSEGECSLVAFCYFIAKLEEVETHGKELIVWIDDPISSLDSNHIFFVYSLIEHILASPIKSPGQQNTYKYSQLFISTHNLDFLKYLKRLSKPKNSFEYFILERTNDTSKIGLMPKYLKNYVTEFNYLFSQVHACAHSTAQEIGHESFYNFGNNLRKFLEAYLFYRFPNNLTNDEKLRLFFGGNQIATSLANRVNNELSHLEEIFDRSMKPLDVPEITSLANFVLNTINNKDPDQYNALIESMSLS